MTGERLREALLDASDHRACRNVWAAHTGDGDADRSDYVETMRATGGDVAVVAADGAADVYARWTGSGFEHLTLWPPWTLGGVDRTDRAGLEAVLAEADDLRAVHHEETPFDRPETIASMGGRPWP